MDPRLVRIHAVAVDKLPAKEGVEYLEGLTDEVRTAVQSQLTFKIVFMPEVEEESDDQLVIQGLGPGSTPWVLRGDGGRSRKVFKQQFTPVGTPKTRPEFVGEEGAELMVHFANEEKSVAKFIDGAWQDAAGRRWRIFSEVTP